MILEPLEGDPDSDYINASYIDVSITIRCCRNIIKKEMCAFLFKDKVFKKYQHESIN